MSQEIVAQPALTKVECEVILTALEWFGQAVQQPHDADQKDTASQAVKKEQYMIVAAGVRGKIARNVIARGNAAAFGEQARHIKPGGGRFSRPL